MSPRGGAGCVFRLCVIVAVILECNNATGLEVTTVIGILKTGPLIIQEILDMWDELGKTAYKLIYSPFMLLSYGLRNDTARSMYYKASKIM